MARVAELLHPGLDLSERAANLVLRIELGLPRDLVGLARRATNTLARGDYLRLLEAGLITPDTVDAAEDRVVPACLGGNVQKLRSLRNALRARPAEVRTVQLGPILPPPDE